MFVFDSDVLIDFLRGSGPLNERVSFELEKGAVTISAMTAFELEAGAKTPRSQAAVTMLMDAVAILPVSASQAQRAGQIFRQLAARGLQIDLTDCLIAAACLEHRASLVTRNLRHFERVEGLEIAWSARQAGAGS